MIEVPSAARKICALTAATELYPWEPWEVDRAFTTAQQLCADLPVIQYTCTKEPEAVDALKAYLEKMT